MAHSSAAKKADAVFKIALLPSQFGDLTPEHLRERISELLRRYIPRTTLPTVETERELASADPIHHSERQDKHVSEGAEL